MTNFKTHNLVIYKELEEIMKKINNGVFSFILKLHGYYIVEMEKIETAKYDSKTNSMVFNSIDYNFPSKLFASSFTAILDLAIQRTAYGMITFILVVKNGLPIVETTSFTVLTRRKYNLPKDPLDKDAI